ncbi:MAG: hypothetical protein Q8N98_01670 [bacterium]|nr:hypothetical protein [bacterium]
MIKKAKTDTYKFSVFRPGGNDTALVEPFVDGKILRRKVNDAIMVSYPNIEQVGFVDKANRRLEMAGGEFCGNATRSAAFYFLDGRPGIINIKISGINKGIVAGIDPKNNVWTEIPIYSDIKRVRKVDNLTIVELKGITQVVVSGKGLSFVEKTIKDRAFDILKSLNLIRTCKAAGVMFTSEKNGRVAIDPVVWVRDIQTLFYETACASGTAAVGMVEALKRNKNINNMSITQPSGSEIKVSVLVDKNRFKKVKISGKIQVLKTDIALNI